MRKISLIIVHCSANKEDTRTEEQKRALRMLLEDLHKRYPKALIVGHCDLDPMKPCCPGGGVMNDYRLMINDNEN